MPQWRFFAAKGPDYVSRAGPLSWAAVSLPGSRHVCYMTTAASVVSRDPGIAVLGSQQTGLKFFHIITFAGSAQPIKAARLQRVISIPCTSHQLPAIIKLYRAAHTFFASKSRLLRSPAVHCISHQLG